MQQFLVIYDRRAGTIIRHRGYSSSHSALAARFTAEREFRSTPDVEVVVLGADSWEALKTTHSRYFKPVQELAEAALAREACSA
jgi:hypothetical protein